MPIDDPAACSASRQRRLPPTRGSRNRFMHNAPAAATADQSGPRKRRAKAISPTPMWVILRRSSLRVRGMRGSGASRPPGPSPPTPLPCVPPHTLPERERGATSQPQKQPKQPGGWNLVFGWGRPLPLGVGGGGTRGGGSGRGRAAGRRGFLAAHPFLIMTRLARTRRPFAPRVALLAGVRGRLGRAPRLAPRAPAAP